MGQFRLCRNISAGAADPAFGRTKREVDGEELHPGAVYCARRAGKKIWHCRDVLHNWTQIVTNVETVKKSAAKKTEIAATGKSAGAEAFIGTPDKIKWVQFAPGIEYRPVHGDCDKPGAPCVFQLRFAAGGKIPAHWHPVDENVTVISGTFMAGMGDSYDEAKMTTLPAGTYVFMPKRMHHFAGTKDGALVQVHGVGPSK